MQATCVVLVALGLALIPFVEPSCIINSGGTSTTVPFGKVLVMNCITFKCETVNGVTALHLQGQAFCQLKYPDNSTECFAAGTTRHCITCHGNNITHPVYTTRKCISGSNCVAPGVTAEHDCASAVCNSTTYAMDVIPGTKTKCDYGNLCIAPGQYKTIPYNATIQYNCTCKNLDLNQLGCHLIQTSGSSGGSGGSGGSGSTQSCTVDGTTVPYGNTTVSNCNTFICETRNGVTRAYIQGQAACKLRYVNGTSACVQAGNTQACATCHYNGSDPATLPYLSYKCSWFDECVAVGQERQHACTRYQCQKSNTTNMVNMGKTECYFNGSCIAPGQYQTFEGYGNCMCTNMATNEVSCNSTQSTSSIQCPYGGQTLSGGATVTANCNTRKCEIRNGVPGLYIQGQARCSVRYSNGTESCILPGTSEACVSCHYDAANTTHPLSTTQQCYVDGECFAGGLSVEYNCADYICNDGTYQLDLVSDNKCFYKGVCVALGASKMIDGYGNCTCTEASNDTLTCVQPSTPSSNCIFNGETVPDGETEIWNCNTYSCENRNGSRRMYIINQPHCNITYENGTSICLAAGSARGCTTCIYDPDKTTNKFSLSKECALGDTCLAGGAEVVHNCVRYRCNGTTYAVEEVDGPRTQCLYEGKCVTPGEYHTFSVGYCTCANVPNNQLSCFASNPQCPLNNGSSVPLGTTIFEQCNNKTCENRNGVLSMRIQPPGYCSFTNGQCLKAGLSLSCYTCHFNSTTAKVSTTRECNAAHDGCIKPGEVGDYNCGRYRCNAANYQLEVVSKTKCRWNDNLCTAVGEYRLIGTRNCTCKTVETDTFSCYP